MPKSSKVRKSTRQNPRSEVLRALSSHLSRQSGDLGAEFQRSPDWQKASHLLDCALNMGTHHRNGTFLSPPSGWLPPLC